ncbi:MULTISPECIES: hypothetical protein [unclassified Flavobacterium]|uniref:hypothetical protein n=1 Tax=unclassified Flavobacterium TaxID=196869 RepID=UPI001290AFFE|nr:MULTISPECIES: hypothetical protein [unclassified Flavobacterium]MQP52661.1 hypothetical protein [Flavobacterium sp. LMO9]MQP62159.1 hypothetical protein [Flavobacterium sp. LMO6]
MKYFFIYTFLTLNFLNVYCQSIEELSAEIYRDSSFIFNDSVKKIFKGDVIYLIDFNEKNKIYKGYINGCKESIKSNNLIIADSTLQKIEKLNPENKKLLNEISKNISKKHYQIEYRKASDYFEKAKIDSTILVNFIDENYFVKSQNFIFQYINLTNKPIKSIQIKIEGFDDFYDTKKRSTKKFKILEKNKTGGCHFLSINWKVKPKFQTLASITIHFENGQIKKISDIQYLPEEWLYILSKNTFKKCD